MKIVMVVHGEAFGGVHNQAVQLSTAWSGTQDQLVVVVPSSARARAGQNLEQAGVRVIYTPLERPRLGMGWSRFLRLSMSYAAQIVRLARLLRKEGPDVVQTHGLQHLDVPLAALFARIPLCWQLVDTRPSARLRSLLSPAVRMLSSVIMTTGHGTALRYPGVAESRKLVTFAPASGLGETILGRDMARERLGVREDQLLVGCLANYNPQKGHHRLVRAFQSAQIPEAALRLRGQLTPGHEDYARSLGWADRDSAEVASLGGMCTRDFLDACDVVVLAAEPDSEGMPTVLIEAAGRSKPCVATSVAATEEIVVHGVTGFLVSPEGPESEIGEALRRLQDPHLRRRLGQAAYQLFASEFTIDRFLEAHRRAYRLAMDR